MSSLYKEYKDLRISFALSTLALAFVLFIFNNFLTFVEQRHGVTLVDPVLALIEPRNVGTLIFILIYSSLALALILLSKRPRDLLTLIQAYTLLTLFRFVVMYLVPLEPPPEIIILRDPFVEMFSKDRVLMKDLFFSGHTSILFLLTCSMKTGGVKILFLCTTVLVALLILAQHAHYTVDVVAAPFFSFAAWQLARGFLTKTSETYR